MKQFTEPRFLLADIEQGVVAGLWLRPESTGWRYDLSPLADSSRHEGREGPWLVPSAPLTRYAMFRRPRLLPDFVAIGRSNDEQTALDRIARFSSRYGLLGRPKSLIPSNANAALGPKVEDGESFKLWIREARKVAVLDRLGRHVNQGNVRELRPFVRWSGTGVTVRVISRNGEPDAKLSGRPDAGRREPLPLECEVDTLEIATRGFDPYGVLDTWDRRTPMDPVKYYIHACINRALHGHVHRAVIPYVATDIRYFPDSLLAAIHVQLQNEIVGTTGRERECANSRCRERVFEPRRKDQRFCSKSCRNAANYHQRSSAREA